MAATNSLSQLQHGGHRLPAPFAPRELQLWHIPLFARDGCENAAWPYSTQHLQLYCGHSCFPLRKKKRLNREEIKGSAHTRHFASRCLQLETNPAGTASGLGISFIAEVLLHREPGDYFPFRSIPSSTTHIIHVGHDASVSLLPTAVTAHSLHPTQVSG